MKLSELFVILIVLHHVCVDARASQAPGVQSEASPVGGGEVFTTFFKTETAVTNFSSLMYVQTLREHVDEETYFEKLDLGGSIQGNSTLPHAFLKSHFSGVNDQRMSRMIEISWYAYTPSGKSYTFIKDPAPEQMDRCMNCTPCFDVPGTRTLISAHGSVLECERWVSEDGQMLYQCMDLGAARIYWPDVNLFGRNFAWKAADIKRLGMSLADYLQSSDSEFVATESGGVWEVSLLAPDGYRRYTFRIVPERQHTLNYFAVHVKDALVSDYKFENYIDAADGMTYPRRTIYRRNLPDLHGGTNIVFTQIYEVVCDGPLLNSESNNELAGVNLPVGSKIYDTGGNMVHYVNEESVEVVEWMGVSTKDNGGDHD